MQFINYFMISIVFCCWAAPDPQAHLRMAIAEGNLGDAQRAIERGAHVNEWSHFNGTPLMQAASRKRLERKGKSNEEIIRFLLKHGANPNHQDQGILRGKTALMFAADQEDLDSVLALLEARADPNLRDTRGNTALLDAIFPYKPLLLKQRVEIVKSLLNAGADLNISNQAGRSPLSRALDRGEPETIALLINNGVIIPENLQNNPLLQVVPNFFTLIKNPNTSKEAVHDKISELKKVGYHITGFKDKDANNILHIVAATDINPEVAKLLIYYFPALMTKKNSFQKTPFELALVNHDRTALFMEGMAAMPDSWKKNMWDSLSPADQKRAGKLREILKK